MPTSLRTMKATDSASSSAIARLSRCSWRMACAHALLHEKFDSRALAELAESTAYLVCQALGIDSSDYSFGYVATWAGGGDQAIAGIKASCERIQKTAATILRAFEPAPVEEAA
jgi:hypothetical protein